MFDIVERVTGYAELHCHTNFSFLDGASHPEDLVEMAIDLEYEALAVTDHDGFYGVSRVWQAAQATGLPVIYGVEVGLEKAASHSDPVSDAEKWDRDRYARSKGAQGRLRRGRSVRAHGTKPTDLPETDHLVLLAGSPSGYRSLSRFVTRAQLRGEKDHPIYAWEDLAEAAENRDVHALTGCHAGAVPRAAARGDLSATIRETARLKDLFGTRLHLELWHHGMPEDDARNDLMWEVGGKLALSTVATNQVHYHKRSDAYLSEVLAAIGGRRTLAVADGFRPATDERYLKTAGEMVERFRPYPGAVARSLELGRRLAFDLGLMAPRLPDFPMPGHFRDEMEYLEALTWEGARDVYPGSDDGVSPEARRRLRHELDIISRLGFAGYFLVVKDLVDFARSQDIYCQIRGSGADSAVCRCIGLTRVDPIRLHLPFERFLSEERGKPPDIDVDFEADRREEVIQYCYRKYGRERAAMVANVITYRARSVLRDVAKTFGFTQAQVDGLSQYVDTRDPSRLRDSDAALPEGMTAEMIYDICWRLDGYPRHLGIHSGGMVIADRPLWQVVPLEWGRMEGRTVIQWDKDDSAAVGIVKFDLLGLGMLNALHLTHDLIEDHHGIDIDLARIPQEPTLYRSMTRADTVGVFQIESRAQMATLPKMKPKTFYDLAVEVALIRPGPIQGQSVHPYLRRRNGDEPVRYPHPLAEPILKKTLGVPIFQEQLMELARVCAGFDGGQADRLRQAMTHKRSEQAMGRLRDEVYSGMASNGIVGAAADEIWEKLQGFASFGFPESHSVSFAYIVYMSVWLRFHYPSEFLAGLLNAQPMGFYSPNSLVQDAQRHGVMILGPDVNTSWHDCTIEAAEADTEDIVSYLGESWRRGRGHVDDPIRPAVAVRMGLRYVRNLGEKEITRIEAARILGGAFESPEDLAFRTGLDVDALEGLAASGALSSVGLGRREGLWAAGALAEIDPGRLALSPGVESPELSGMSKEEEHRADLWSTGVSGRHPMSFVRDRLGDCMTAAEALDLQRHGARVKVAGVVTHRQRPGTAKGVHFLNLEDETGLLNIVVLPDVWATHRQVVRKSPALVIHGRLEFNDGVTNIVARDFEPIGIQTVKSRDFR
ncbi:MAG: DNA polymerase III subunit alpha [Actinobacteria bacterium]|nr:MAG: DNA polymerase III subunit alpha [Actinomycetota bacterium]REK26019.1 MAG: DNA polymerase III subunit alpha [Actinomycetota bacterium]